MSNNFYTFHIELAGIIVIIIHSNTNSVLRFVKYTPTYYTPCLIIIPYLHIFMSMIKITFL